MSTEAKIEKFSPATDIVESEQGFYMYMDLPGVSRENLEIDLEDNSLVVTGRTAYTTAENEKFLDREFSGGEYVRRFTVADIVDRKSIKANLKNGVLELFLPKIPEVQPRKIQISAE